MKNFVKVFFAAAVLFAAAATASAVPAHPGTFKYKQPDGTVIELRRHGDEFFNWTTRVSDGAVVELGADGFYRPGTLDPARREAGREMRKKMNELRANDSKGLRTHNNNPMTHGQHHVPVILVEYADLGFVIDNPAESFSNMLNQQGYSVNGGTGSVRDYYYDNSHGAYEPVFDVFGPVTLTGKMADYGTNRAAYALVEAAKSLNSQIDFSQYDSDNDGKVDMILMYYPGHNPAEHGPEENIWPHQSLVNYYTAVRLDGKLLSRYFCTSELKGSSGSTMCGIGTTSHEFAHSLGLPDFYDTDYGENGECGGLYKYSIMDAGPYNNDGCTPPYFNSEERILLGWMLDADVPELQDGNVTLASVKDDYAYRSYTETEGEYFVYECRDGSGWDAPLPGGMVVYHVDKSKTRTVGGITPYAQWADWDNYNTINAYGDHPCFYIVPAYDQTSLNFQYNMNYLVFPGSGKVKTYSPVDWDNFPTGTNLSGISYSGKQVSFTVSTSVSRILAGYVKDSRDNPIAGATVTVSKPSQSAGVQRRVAPLAPESFTVTTDAAGAFAFDMSSYESETVHLAVAKSGYLMVSQDVTLSARGARINITLYPESDGSAIWLKYYDVTADSYVYGLSSISSTIMIPAGELAAYKGRKIDRVRTYLDGNSVQAVYVIAEAGGTRLLNHKIDNPVFGSDFEIDLSDDNLMVPEGQDLYIGLAIKGADTEHPICIFVGSGNWYYSSFSLSGNTQWMRFTGYDLLFAVHIAASGPTDPYENYENLAAQGYNVIYPGDSFTHKAGDEFQLRLFEASGNNKPASIEWLYDGQAVSGQSVKLAKGSHKITAKLVLADGRKEEVDLEITAQ